MLYDSCVVVGLSTSMLALKQEEIVPSPMKGRSVLPWVPWVPWSRWTVWGCQCGEWDATTSYLILVNITHALYRRQKLPVQRSIAASCHPVYVECLGPNGLQGDRQYGEGDATTSYLILPEYHITSSTPRQRVVSEAQLNREHCQYAYLLWWWDQIDSFLVLPDWSDSPVVQVEMARLLENCECCQPWNRWRESREGVVVVYTLGCRTLACSPSPGPFRQVIQWWATNTSSCDQHVLSVASPSYPKHTWLLQLADHTLQVVAMAMLVGALDGRRERGDVPARNLAHPMVATPTCPCPSSSPSTNSEIVWQWSCSIPHRSCPPSMHMLSYDPLRSTSTNLHRYTNGSCSKSWAIWGTLWRNPNDPVWLHISKDVCLLTKIESGMMDSLS